MQVVQVVQMQVMQFDFAESHFPAAVLQLLTCVLCCKAIIREVDPNIPHNAIHQNLSVSLSDKEEGNKTRNTQNKTQNSTSTEQNSQIWQGRFLCEVDPWPQSMPSKTWSGSLLV